MPHTQVQRARGTSAQNLAYTGPAGELTVNTDDWSLRVHDGATLGGWALRTVGTNYSYQQPASGMTLVAGAHLAAYVIDPAGPLAAVTIVMPSAPNDGDIFEASTTQPIAALTVAPAAGQALQGGGLVGLGPNGALAWRYRAANSTWYRIHASGLAGFALAVQVAKSGGIV